MKFCRRGVPAGALAVLLWGSAAALAEDAAPPAEAAPPRADLTLANDLVRTGSYAEAEKILTALQAEFPEDSRVLLMRGEVLLALQRAAEALPLLQRCAEIDPARPRLHFQLGTALQATGDVPGAIAAFGREIEVNEDPRVRVLARLNRSLLLEGQQDWLTAAAELEAAIQLEPTRLEAYGDLATLYMKAARLDDASRALVAGHAAGFRSASHLYSVGARYLQEHAYGPASEAFRSALEIDPGFADALRNLGVALDQLGREQEAVQHFRRYLDLRPDAPDAAEITRRIQGARP